MGSSAVARSWPRRLLRGAVFLGLAYLGICLVMWSIENRLVFQPTPATRGWNEKPDPAIEDVAVTPTIHGWWLADKPEAPVLLLCGGNGGNLSGRGKTIVRMRERLGVSVLIIDYPGYGKSEGEPSESGCYDAAEGALAWLAAKGVPSDRVILYGESMGGGVATEMATRHPVKSLVLVKTFTSMPAAAKSHYPWLPTSWLMTNRFDNIQKLPNIHCPVFIASATNDRVVPYFHGEKLHEVANEPKHFFRDEGNDHNDSLPDEFWVELKSFMHR